MKLSQTQKRHLRTLGHHLKPVVWIGQHGLKGTVIAEIEQGLDSHELIKVKIVADRETRAQIASDICSQTHAEPIHAIGQMLILFRRNKKEPRIALPSR
ncbi:MAG: ribosome assembly RNA-binding protein YhbY [Gammaproteobacteria bacterium]|nr:ribosome assembly RNA-binding protein YhbY [Gammaproteobacteria bacterium]